jgi:hypothetical protein
VGFNDLPIGHDFGLGLFAKTAGAQQGACGQSNEAKAPKALTTDHGLQQKAVRPLVLNVSEFEVERERGFQIGECLRHQRNAVVALCGQLIEFDFGHHGMSLHSSAPKMRGAFIQKFALQLSRTKREARRKKRALDVRRTWLTPGPSSPVVTTCDSAAMNEHKRSV